MMERRNFLSSLFHSGAAAAVMTALGAAAFSKPASAAASDTLTASDADVVLRPGRSLEIAGSAKLGVVELRGGSITTREGGVFEIASLRKG